MTVAIDDRARAAVPHHRLQDRPRLPRPYLAVGCRVGPRPRSAGTSSRPPRPADRRRRSTPIPSTASPSNMRRAASRQARRAPSTGASRQPGAGLYLADDASPASPIVRQHRQRCRPGALDQPGVVAVLRARGRDAARASARWRAFSRYRPGNFRLLVGHDLELRATRVRPRFSRHCPCSPRSLWLDGDRHASAALVARPPRAAPASTASTRRRADDHGRRCDCSGRAAARRHGRRARPARAATSTGDARPHRRADGRAAARSPTTSPTTLKTPLTRLRSRAEGRR